MKNKFTVTTELNTLEREALLTLPNPKYNERINNYSYLGGMQMHGTDTKNLLLIHVILGASDSAKKKMGTCPRVGQISEPFAKQTKIGWIIMSLGRESDIVSALFTKTSVNGYKKLYDTDVLGLKDSHYNAGMKRVLGWKEGNLSLGNNKNRNVGSLKSLVRNLKRDSEIHKAYDTVIQEQVQNKIIQSVSNKEISNCKKLYLPHKPVTRKEAESTKLRVIYFPSTKYETGFSLNDY